MSMVNCKPQIILSKCNLICNRKKAAKIKADYKRDYFHPTAEVDFDFAGPMVTAASVFG